ncbi:MAG: hypothetical protein M5R42_02405 [Rhodocyclaceae bacterium]|nr:hypothetical protein [Rhodocyclaceae bacterium]
MTPQIDEDSNIILHIRPSVSVVTERNKVINLGTLGTFQLPLASSSINETDSIVRVRDGNIVALGGLMEYIQSDDGGKVPGVGDVPGVNAFFKQGKERSAEARDRRTPEADGDSRRQAVGAGYRRHARTPARHGASAAPCPGATIAMYLEHFGLRELPSASRPTPASRSPARRIRRRSTRC